MRSGTLHSPLSFTRRIVFDPNAPALRVSANHRKRIWELSGTFHCSIIGTCLSNAEVRKLLRKIGDPEAETASEHLLHMKAVSMAGRENLAGKLLDKVLCGTHERFMRRFAKAKTADELRSAWQEAVAAGDVAGGYWAAMTHPACDKDLAAALFGEVHMLSHLIGRTNRADLKRLAALEAEHQEQEARLVALEGRVQALGAEKVALAEALEAARQELRLERRRPEPALPADGADLRQKAADERARAAELAGRLAESEAGLADAEARALRFAGEARALAAELEAAEAVWDGLAAPVPLGPDLDGQTVLYVGGRPKLLDRLRHLAGRAGGRLLSHDGGIEEAMGLLPGLVAQADAVLVPIDCVSHAAMGQTKRLCQDLGKPWLPLRSASAASFLVAMGGLSAAK